MNFYSLFFVKVLSFIVYFLIKTTKLSADKGEDTVIGDIKNCEVVTLFENTIYF